MHTKVKRLIDGTRVSVYDKCSCSNVNDQIFHQFFREIDWHVSKLKYLNKVQDKWMNYCNTQISHHKHSDEKTCLQRVQRKIFSEKIIIEFFTAIQEEIQRAELFYRRKRRELIHEFIVLQVQTFELVKEQYVDVDLEISKAKRRPSAFDEDAPLNGQSDQLSRR